MRIIAWLLMLHNVLGLCIMLVAAGLFYTRIKEWQKFKSECMAKNTYWTDENIKEHRRKLIIYAIIFAIGLFV